MIGVAFDGTGYGDDGHTWGAEILVADLVDYRRVAPTPLRAAARRRRGRPLALARGARVPFARARISATPSPSRSTAWSLAPCEVVRASDRRRGVNTPLASSMGRLFDAAAAVLGVCRESHFEGEAAMRLEGRAGRHEAEPLPYEAVAGDDGVYRFDPLPLLAALGERALAR